MDTWAAHRRQADVCRVPASEPQLQTSWHKAPGDHDISLYAIQAILLLTVAGSVELLCSEIGKWMLTILAGDKQYCQRAHNITFFCNHADAAATFLESKRKSCGIL